MRTAACVIAALTISGAAEAHVRITPRESKVGATETYTARVPTEGKVTTTSVELEVPEGVTIMSAAAPAGGRADLKRTGERVVAVTWTMDIAPGQAAELTFVAVNPKSGDQIVWKVHQRYADGTASDWVGPAGNRSPAPVTRLLTAQERPAS